MADPFSLTPHPVRVTGATKQPLDQALDVSDYDSLDALLGLLGVEGTANGATIRLITAMQNDTEQGWVELVAFSSVSTANTYDVQNVIAKLLKYIRWEVTGLGGATAITFSIDGMLRTNAG